MIISLKSLSDGRYDVNGRELSGGTGSKRKKNSRIFEKNTGIYFGAFETDHRRAGCGKASAEYNAAGDCKYYRNYAVESGKIRKRLQGGDTCRIAEVCLCIGKTYRDKNM